MAMVINSNIMSLNSQRNLMISQGDQNQAMERLSSGKRINSAADDAAGLAISNRMTSQVRGLDQAIRNANDGISLIQTAEGALDETTNILQRMRELSIQSANGTYDDGNRATLNAEVQQLVSEIDRISETTKFNGLQILDGTLGDVDLQAGADANETISLNIGATDTKSLGSSQGGTLVGQEITDTNIMISSDTLVKINGQFVEKMTTAAMENLISAINNSIEDVEASAVLSIVGDGEADGILTNAQELTITATGLDGTDQVFKVSDTGSLQDMVDKINDVAGSVLTASIADGNKLQIDSTELQTLVIADPSTDDDATGFATADLTTRSRLVLDSSAENEEITFQISTADGVAAFTYAEWGIDERNNAGEVQGNANASGTLAKGDLKINGVEVGAGSAAGAAAHVEAINAIKDETGVFAELTSAGSSRLQLTSISGQEFSIVGSTGANLIGFEEVNESIEGIGNTIADLDISTAAGAQKAIGTIDAALEQINETRGDLGAINNRLDFTINNLSNVSENVAAARSRIEDADFAAESAALSRAQVLQQAGTAMLAQANAAPQQVLSLLQ